MVNQPEPVEPLSSMSRAIRKPLMEKRRRARMNDSLDALKHILLASSAHMTRLPGAVARMDKADILELTVQFLQHLLHKPGAGSTGVSAVEERAPSEATAVWRPW